LQPQFPPRSAAESGADVPTSLGIDGVIKLVSRIDGFEMVGAKDEAIAWMDATFPEETTTGIDPIGFKPF